MSCLVTLRFRLQSHSGLSASFLLFASTDFTRPAVIHAVSVFFRLLLFPLPTRITNFRRIITIGGRRLLRSLSLLFFLMGRGNADDRTAS